MTTYKLGVTQVVGLPRDARPGTAISPLLPDRRSRKSWLLVGTAVRYSLYHRPWCQSCQYLTQGPFGCGGAAQETQRPAIRPNQIITMRKFMIIKFQISDGLVQSRIAYRTRYPHILYKKTRASGQIVRPRSIRACLIWLLQVVTDCSSILNRVCGSTRHTTFANRLRNHRGRRTDAH